MTQFKTLAENCQSELDSIYPENGFPLLIRQECAQFIEEPRWQLLPISTQTSEFRPLSSHFIQELMQHCEASGNVALKREAEKLRKRYGEDADGLIKKLRKCLMDEKIALDRHVQQCKAEVVYQREYVEETALIDQLENTRTNIKKFKACIDDLATKFGGFPQGGNIGQTAASKKAKGQIVREIEGIYENLNSNVLPVLLRSLEQVHILIARWRHRMRCRILKFQNELDGELDQLERMCTIANEASLDFLSLVKKGNDPDFPVDLNSNECLAKLYVTTEEMVRKHLNRVFVVTKQHVTGGKQEIDSPEELVLNVSGDRQGQLAITAKFLGATTLKDHVAFHKEPILRDIYRNGDLVMLEDTTSPMKQTSQYRRVNSECDESQMQRELKIDFEKVIFPGIRKGAKGRSQSAQKDQRVTEEKYWVVICVHLSVSDIEMYAKTVCLPITMITQVSQYWGGIGTLLWNAAFSTSEAILEEKESVSWEELCGLLQMYLRKFTMKNDNNEGIELNPDQLEQMKQYFGQLTATDLIRKETFLRGSMPRREGLPLWKWIYACFCFIKDHHDLWKQGIIFGFITKEKINELLAEENAGTFIIRFRETGIEECQKRCFWVKICIFVTGEQMRVFPIRGHLKPENIRKHGLKTILPNMETDCSNGGHQPLLKNVWHGMSMEQLKTQSSETNIEDGDENYIGEPQTFYIDLKIDDDSTTQPSTSQPSPCTLASNEASLCGYSHHSPMCGVESAYQESVDPEKTDVILAPSPFINPDFDHNLHDLFAALEQEVPADGGMQDDVLHVQNTNMIIPGINMTTEVDVPTTVVDMSTNN